VSRHPKPAVLASLPTGSICPSLLFSLLLVLGGGKATGQAPDAPAEPANSAPAVTPSRLQPVLASSRGLRVLLSSDEPTGVYYDRDTVETQTDIILSYRVYNDDLLPRRVALTYSVRDAAGKVKLLKNPSFQIPARGLLHRRELFSAPARGGFVLRFEAVARRDGPDDKVQAELPFAVVVAPQAGYRPQSFFALDAPLSLPAAELDLYKRIGARALRSPWMPISEATPNDQFLERKLQERLNREIATIGVLPAASPGGDDSGWSRQMLPLLVRFRAVRTWEIEGLPAASDLQALDRAASQLRPAPVLIGSLPPSTPPTLKLPGFDGLTVPLDERGADGRDEDPAATLRLLMARQKALQPTGAGTFYVRRSDTPNTVATNPLTASGALVSQHMLAVMSGANGMSTGLDPAATLRQTPSLNGTALARGAAFAAMNRTLEDTAYHSDLFPRSPELWGALFKGKVNTVAVLWTTREAGGRLSLRLAGNDKKESSVRVLDVFGNTIAQEKGGTTQIQLSPQPVYVIAATEPEVLARALRSAQVDGLRPLAAQVLPIPFRPGAPGNKAPLQVRVQNLLLQPVTGVLQLTPPAGWTLGKDVQQYKLAPGESRVYDFVVTSTQLAADGTYPVTVTARAERNRWQWQQAVRVAVAENVTRGQAVRVDGDLSEWQDVSWMEMKASGVTSRLAVRWDARRLYFAAQVVEPTFAPRRPEEAAYNFWKNNDAIQLAFGLRDQIWSQPARGPFRDADYGFLMSPFAPGASGGRLLRLWSPTVAAGASGDQVRWAGAVPGSSCSVRRNETDKTTTYEACLPLTELPDLQPSLRAERGNKQLAPVRFGWMLHDDQEPALQWSQTTGVFPWWSNTNSFLPAQAVHYAVQNSLGFTSNGSVDDGLTPQPRPTASVFSPVAPRSPLVPVPTATPLPPAPIVPEWTPLDLPPLPATQPTPTPRPTATPRPRPTPTPRIEPPSLRPMPPSTLPPAAPPAEGTIPPSLPPA